MSILATKLENILLELENERLKRNKKLDNKRKSREPRFAVQEAKTTRSPKSGDKENRRLQEMTDFSLSVQSAAKALGKSITQSQEALIQKIVEGDNAILNQLSCYRTGSTGQGNSSISEYAILNSLFLLGKEIVKRLERLCSERKGIVFSGQEKDGDTDRLKINKHDLDGGNKTTEIILAAHLWLSRSIEGRAISFLPKDRVVESQYCHSKRTQSSPKAELKFRNTMTILSNNIRRHKCKVDDALHTLLMDILVQSAVEDDERFLNILSNTVSRFENLDNDDFLRLSVQFSLAKRYVADIIKLKKKFLVKEYFTGHF